MEVVHAITPSGTRYPVLAELLITQESKYFKTALGGRSRKQKLVRLSSPAT
jgi:hypothetical protein